MMMIVAAIGYRATSAGAHNEYDGARSEVSLISFLIHSTDLPYDVRKGDRRRNQDDPSSVPY